MEVCANTFDLFSTDRLILRILAVVVVLHHLVETRPKNDKTYSYSLPVPIVERYVPGATAWSPEESESSACKSSRSFFISLFCFLCGSGIPADLFRFVGTSYNDAIYLFGGQGIFNNVTLTYPIK